MGGQRGPRILVVEDDTDVQRLMVSALASEYQTETAVDGAAGLEKALALRPDLIVTDVKMPGITGAELVRQVRRHPELDTTPILVLSGLGDTAVRIQLLSEGAQTTSRSPSPSVSSVPASGTSSPPSAPAPC